MQGQKAEERWAAEKKALLERLERLQKVNKTRRAEADTLTAQARPSASYTLLKSYCLLGRYCCISRKCSTAIVPLR